VTRPCPDAAALRLAFTRTERRAQRKSDGTIVIEGRRFEVPEPISASGPLEVRFAAWDLTQVHLSIRTPARCCADCSLRTRPNADGLRRSPAGGLGRARRRAGRQRHGAGCSHRTALERMIDPGATGLPPAYLPKDEGDDA
jgi:putative transposase